MKVDFQCPKSTVFLTPSPGLISEIEKEEAGLLNTLAHTMFLLLIFFKLEVIAKMRDYIKAAFVNRLYWGALRKLHNEYYSNKRKLQVEPPPQPSY